MTTAPAIQIDRLKSQSMIIPIKGTMPLIVHNFSHKSKTAMLEAQQGVKKVKEIRDPQAEYEASLYHTANGFGFPVTAFKAATVGSARFYGKAVNMTQLRQFLFMHGAMSDKDPQALVEIHGEPRMREDVVRLGGMPRSADLRYRAEFPEWTAELHVEFVASSIGMESVLSLIDAGGRYVGVGEWRPEKRGEYGTYCVDVDREIVFLEGA